ncbi:unnamed protein product [Effrenium voratum]|nr:unnamed protein product [Effrenium voratum]
MALRLPLQAARPGCASKLRPAKALLAVDPSRGGSFESAGSLARQGRRIAACSTVCGLVWSARARRVLRAKKKRQETPYDPIVEYRRVQEDPIGSWGFLEDDEFAKKMLGFSSVSFLISLVLSTTVFPVSNEEGILLPNMAAAFCYALGLGMATTFVLLLRVSSFVDPLNKNLKARSFIVEDRRDPNTRRAFSPGDGGFYSERVQKSTDEIQRDKLLGEYQTGPAMARLRKYLLGAFGLSVLGWVSGSFTGGEMGIREDADEEFACGSRCIPGLMTDDTRIQRNGYRLFER